MEKDNLNAAEEKENTVNSPEADEAADESPGRVERRKEDRRKKERREGQAAGAGEADRLRDEIESLKETMMRRQADFENYKKRVVKQNAEVRVQAIRDIALDIIHINDDLLRALDASASVTEGESPEASHRSFVEGVSMISRRIEEALAKYGVVEIESFNCEFNPQLCEAVEIESRDDVSVDTVTKVYQKGFRIDDMIVRSAKVRVAKPAGPAAGEKAAPAGAKNEGG